MKQFADISGYQKTVDWAEYVKWSDMVAIKASEGVGFVDPLFKDHDLGVLGTPGIKSIWYYHYARPDLGNAAQTEAQFFCDTVGVIGPQDRMVLDIEQTAPNLVQWVLDFQAYIQHRYTLHKPILYSYESFIKAYLQDERLSSIEDEWIAAYGDVKPSGSPLAWQFTDKATVPGIAGPVDCSYYYGGNSVFDWNAFNTMVVDLWNSQEAYFKALGQELPARDTGIFAMWRQAWLDGHFKGVPLSREYPLGAGIAQNFAGGTAHWVAGQGQWL